MQARASIEHFVYKNACTLMDGSEMLFIFVFLRYVINQKLRSGLDLIEVRE